MKAVGEIFNSTAIRSVFVVPLFHHHDRIIIRYGHAVVLHTWTSTASREAALNPLLGFKDFDGASIQGGDRLVYPDYYNRSTVAGHPVFDDDKEAENEWKEL